MNTYYVNGRQNNTYNSETFLIYLKAIYNNYNKQKNMAEKFKSFKQNINVKFTLIFLNVF